ncbi:MAG TPA: GDYXXLXY domain-containing protein [Firmicutes bacterium]|nr:GDYXXLXY domain-containing protein [Bacillota bacterium]
MSNTVAAIFHDKDDAEIAVRSLKEKGFGDRDISLIAKNEEEGGREGDMSFEEQNLSDGTAAGGALGGLAGLLAGAGALLIPGVGPIIAAGPLAAALTGVVTGGVVGGLIDYGIPEEKGRYYEERIRQGDILVTLKTDKSKEAVRILEENGAEKVEIH